MRIHTRTPMALLLAGLLALGCSDDSTSNQDGGTVDSTPAGGDATISGLSPYAMVKGSTTVKVAVSGAVSGVELLVDGVSAASSAAAPWDLTWDTSKAKDGVRKLTLKVNGNAGAAAALPVVVLNAGLEATWKAGNSGEVMVPPTGYVEQHLRFHWDLPQGTKQIISVLTWGSNDFKLELAIGKGTCPESGTTAKKDESQTSPLAVIYPDTTASSLGTGQWFAHVQLMNPTKVLGKKTPFSVKTYLIK